MEENNQAEFEIQVSISDATDEELDHVTRQLLTEVRDLNVESAELAKSVPAPEGSPEELQKLLATLALGKTKK